MGQNGSASAGSASSTDPASVVVATTGGPSEPCRPSGRQACSVQLVEDLGDPIAWLALAEGVPVYDRGGERIGVVEHVQADEAMDIFEGLIVHMLPLPGLHLFADADQIAELHERGVLLSVQRAELRKARRKTPGSETHPDVPAESALGARLRRAWDWISGRH